jgi:non-canonical purine NTP pyrophosphatase (RdgB/HAM1 family)
MKPVYVTGNPNKAKHFSTMLGHEIEYVILEIEEIQSLDVRKVVEHKAREAFEKIKRPVIVEDTTVIFTALGSLPGPLIKWFLEELKPVGLCKLLDGKQRTAVAGSAIAYFDGESMEIFTREMAGTIAKEPRGVQGWGWDSIFIPEGCVKTNGEMNDEEYAHMYKSVKPFKGLADFLSTLDK